MVPSGMGGGTAFLTSPSVGKCSEYITPGETLEPCHREALTDTWWVT